MVRIINTLSKFFTQTSMNSFKTDKGGIVFVSQVHPVMDIDLETGGMFFLQVSVGASQDNLIVSNKIKGSELIEKVRKLENYVRTR